MNEPKYKLTFWQWVELYVFVYPLWASMEDSKRKTWHDVKKGMEKHEHRFTKPIVHWYKGKPYNFKQCEHEGCRICDPED